MKVKEVIKMIDPDGWFMIRRKGSHRQYKHDYKKGLMTVAGRLSDDLAKRTLHSVFKQDSPDLPGCVATGATIKETLSRMRSAIKFHLEGLKKEGSEILRPSTKVKYIEISI